MTVLLPRAGRGDDDYVLIPILDERFPEGIHPLGPPLEIDARGQRHRRSVEAE